MEIQFWESKRVNLESLFEQMKAKTTRHMASILNVTDSAYYPCFKYRLYLLPSFKGITLIIICTSVFRGMFKTCVAALNEASDITLHLMPLVSHFKVCQFLTQERPKQLHM